MQKHQAEFPIMVMRDVLNVSRSGYYAWPWRRKSESERGQANAKLFEAIRKVHQ